MTLPSKTFPESAGGPSKRLEQRQSQLSSNLSRIDALVTQFYSQIDHIFPPQRRRDLLESLRGFAYTNPKLSVRTLRNLARLHRDNGITGFPMHQPCALWSSARAIRSLQPKRLHLCAHLRRYLRVSLRHLHHARQCGHCSDFPGSNHHLYNPRRLLHLLLGPCNILPAAVGNQHESRAPAVQRRTAVAEWCSTVATISKSRTLGAAVPEGCLPLWKSCKPDPRTEKNRVQGRTTPDRENKLAVHLRWSNAKCPFDGPQATSLFSWVSTIATALRS